ncbi:iron complex outermembrane receptor protein [Sphingobium sp. B2D3A]|uniref:TonB-dependent receptor plug domain-containing protein n=1 Tax=unclassified Sphingobium TaxID=2611147 RepID=UPI0022257975|nr:MULTISPECIES: TonB-dependent receptor [unclassified Sphingobium]MCW2339152.1 iron complex outermembrane receptor protein [Sphingobium sp. B2D3A]MCW2386904.1 iron complex outermembrane receptor protein [Sphingobium sp. B2D3D]
MSVKASRWRLMAAAALVSACVPGVRSAHAQDLSSYSLEDLLTTESTSVAKRRQRLSDSTAAVTILTQEDILRSGAQSIPEVLRLVPGVEVGQIDSVSTAVSVRGFSTRFANNLLVMIDGRSLYVSSLSGVLWDQQLVPLSDIERIEVVRGPGATLWGSNAVNGVINIITKDSIQTQGWQANAFISADGRNGTVRYGGSKDKLSYRAYVTARDIDGLEQPNGDSWNSGSRAVQAGFRLDAVPDENDTITLQGDVQHGTFVADLLQTPPQVQQTGMYSFDGSFSGMNLLGRWSHRWDSQREFNLQAYHDWVQRREFGVNISRTVDDLDASLRLGGDRQELVLGLNVRRTTDSLGSSDRFVSFTVPRETHHWVSGFAQQDLWLVPDRLRLSAGTKAEYNTISGFALQPSVRLLAKPTPSMTIWAAASRAVRTPARFEEAVRVNLGIPAGTPMNPTPMPMVARIEGQADLAAENLDAFELGIRGSLSSSFTYDIAAYYNRYRNLIGYAARGQSMVFSPTPVLLLDYQSANIGKGQTYGVEAAITFSPAPNLKVQANASMQHLSFETDSPTSISHALAGLSPKFQAGMRVSYDVAPNLEVDAWLRHVSALPASDIPAYQDLDLRINYALMPRLNLSLIGQNLLADRRVEFAQQLYPAPRSYVGRSVALRLSVDF